MALQTQVWQKHLVEDFFPDDSFISRSVDDSEYVYYRTVHVPSSGKPSDVKVNRSVLPAEVKQRVDTEVTYDMDELTTDPIRVSNAEEVELEYDKRASVLANDKKEIQRVASENILMRWAKGADSANPILTSGGEREAHTDKGVGKRLKMTSEAIRQAALRMDRQGIPDHGRYMILDPDMYSDLLDSLTEANRFAFISSANVAKGTVGQLYGIDIFKRTKVLRMKSNGDLIGNDEAGEATEVAVGFAWQENSVSRAIGQCIMYPGLKNPQWYSDIFSFLLRVGGSHRRSDKKGLFLIAEGNV